MRALDLFAGCGGASLGLQRAGLGLVASYERCPRAARVHGLLCGEPATVVDLNHLDPATMPDADVWWASPPCQPGSQAGARKGRNDDRDGYPALLRLVRARRPRWLLIENVPGMVQHDRRKCRGSLFPVLDCIGCYHVHIVDQLGEVYPCVSKRILLAADYGVPQSRRRLIVVCGPEPYCWPAPTHGPGRALPWVSAGEALGITCGAFHATRDGVALDGRVISLTRPSPTMTGSSDLYLIQGGPASRQVRTVASVSPTVRTHADIYLYGAGHTAAGAARSVADPAPTVSGGGTVQMVEGVTRRTLTVAERAALQSLPFVEGLTGRMVGNAVPPPMAEAVARSLPRMR